jgi:hypothetical protein
MAKSMSGAIESMSYALFRAAITEPALLEIAAHWHAARGDRLLPAWRGIDACALAPHLPIVWSWRYDFTRDTFVGRLAGEEINAMLGVSIRGKTIEECFAPDAVPVVRQRYQAVMDATVYRLGIVPTARDGATIDHHNEIVTHYKFTH